MSNIVNFWKRIFSPLLALEPHERQNYSIRVILVMTGITLSVFSGLIFSGWVIGMFEFQDVMIMLSLLLVVIVSWQFLGRGRWQLAISLPIGIFFIMGVYGTLLNGIVTNLALFYILATILTAEYFGTNARIIFLAICLITPVSIAYFYHPDPDSLITGAITYGGLLIGITLLEWFSTSQLRGALKRAQATSQKLRSENLERQMAVLALQQSEAKYRAIIESIPSGMLLYELNETQELVLIGANPAAEKILDRDLSNSLGQTIEEVFPNLSTTEIPKEFCQVVLTGKHWENDQFEYDDRIISDVFRFLAFQTSPNRLTVLFESIARHKQHEREQEAFVTLASALRAAANRAEMLPIILHEVGNVVDSIGSYLAMVDMGQNDLKIELADGMIEGLTGYHLPLNAGFNGIVMETKQPYMSNDLPSELRLNQPPGIATPRAALAVPLISKGEIIGVLAVGREYDFDPGEVIILTTMGEMAASAIQRTSFYEDLQQSKIELEEAYDTTLEGWAKALELRDKETEGHSRNVSALTLDLARHMGIAEPDLIQIRRGSLLHDIGKMGVPDAILLKPGSLNEAEMEIIRRHPLYAQKMLASIPFLNSALDIPVYHHEKWNGQGYPFGLKGSQIPLAARIFAIVDVWDALCSDRPYRLAWEKDKVLEYILAESGKHFDPQVVEAFIDLLDQIGE